MASEEGNNDVLLQYDLLSGNVYKFQLDSTNRIDEDKPSICADSKNLYLFSQYENKSNEVFLRLSLFRKNENTGCLIVFKNKTFSVKTITNSKSLCRLHIFFSQSHGTKLYVFYFACKSDCYSYVDHQIKTFNDINLMVICKKSFRILKNQKLSFENIKLDRVCMNLESIRMFSFEKMFYSEKHEKLFIKTDFTDNFYIDLYESFDKCMLVFDLKNDYFYFHEKVLPFSRYDKDKRAFAAGKDGKVYSVSVHSTGTLKRIRSEIRTLKMIENECLVDDKVEWNNFERKYYSEGHLCSACYV